MSTIDERIDPLIREGLRQIQQREEIALRAELDELGIGFAEPTTEQK